MRVRESADPELKLLVERQIRNEARRRLGDYESKFLLSLPPPSKSKGIFNLGTVLYEKAKWPAGLSRGELLQNLAIFGRSGAGKTNLAFHLLRQLADRDVPFLFLDWKRTARHLTPQLRKRIGIYTPGRSLSPFPFNPFIPPPGMEPSVYFGHVVDVLGDAYTLGDGARSVVHTALLECREEGIDAPTVRELIDRVNTRPDKERVRGWKISATRALESLDTAQLTSTERTSQEQLVQTLLNQSAVIELDALSQSGKRFLVPLLALWLYSVRLAAPTREQLNLIIFLEEAHNVLPRSNHRSAEPLLCTLLRQCRELGMAFVVIDQHPHLIAPAALGNSYASVCLNQKDPKDVAKAAAISLVPEDEKRIFSRLPVGQAVVKLQDRWRDPFLIRIPPVDVEKGSVSDAELERYARSSGRDRAGSGQSLPMSRDLWRIRRIQRWDEGLNEDELRFIEDVVTHPDDGVRSRYMRLNLSGEKGNRIKIRLIEKRFLEVETIPVGRTRKVILRVSKEGRRSLGLDAPKGSGNESIAHEYWKRFYARQFREWGYDVQMEAPRKGGRVDVLAAKDGKRIAIEVETGKSRAISNAQFCIRSGVDTVVLVAATRESAQKIQDSLADAGLLIARRLRLILAGHTPFNSNDL